MCVVATIDSIRHTLDAPALEYVPATQSVHSEAPAVQAQRQTARSSRDILRYKRMRAVAYARCIALFVLLVPALRTPAVIPLALAASRIRACMQQDATGSLGTCVHTRMRACQHMVRSAGEKGGSAADTLSTHLSHLSTCPRRTGCTSRQMMKMTRGSRTCPPRMRSQSMNSRLSHSSTFPPHRRCTRRLTAQTQAECGG